MRGNQEAFLHEQQEWNFHGFRVILKSSCFHTVESTVFMQLGYDGKKSGTLPNDFICLIN